MAQRNPIGIYHRQDEIIFYGRRRNGKDIPGSRWAAVRAPGQRALLDAGDLNILRYTGGAVRRRTPTDIANRRAAALRRADLAWLNSERQQAITQVLIDELNNLGATPPLDTNSIEAAFLLKLSAMRGS